MLQFVFDVFRNGDRLRDLGQDELAEAAAELMDGDLKGLKYPTAVARFGRIDRSDRLSPYMDSHNALCPGAQAVC